MDGNELRLSEMTHDDASVDVHRPGAPGTSGSDRPGALTPTRPPAADGLVRGGLLLPVRLDTTALTPEENTLLELFLQLPAAELLQGLCLLYHWRQAPAPQRALALKLLNPRLTDKYVARVCGLSDRQLRRYPQYRRFARLLRQQHHVLPCGSKDHDGHVEAWAADE